MDLQAFLDGVANWLELEPAQLTPDYEIAWDSLFVLSTMVLATKHCGVTLAPDDVVQCRTIDALVRLIRTHSPAQSAA